MLSQTATTPGLFVVDIRYSFQCKFNWLPSMSFQGNTGKKMPTFCLITLKSNFKNAFIKLLNFPQSIQPQLFLVWLFGGLIILIESRQAFIMSWNFSHNCKSLDRKHIKVFLLLAFIRRVLFSKCPHSTVFWEELWTSNGTCRNLGTGERCNI